MTSSALCRWFATVALCAMPLGPQAQTPDRIQPQPLLIAHDAERPVRVESLDIRTSIAGSFARTTVEMVFRNPNSRLLEGELQFPLQASQQVQGFALDIDGELRPAVPVPKSRGRQVFEAVERRQVDPALLEKTVGNHFKLRVYPIPAQGTRRVRLEFAEALQRTPSGLRLELPLALAETVDSFQLRVSANGVGNAPRVYGAFADLDFRRDGDGYSARVERRAFRPATGLALVVPAVDEARAYVQAANGEHYFFAEAPVAAAGAPRKLPKNIVLLWDSSGSASKRDLQGEIAVLDRYFAAVRDGEVRLVRLRDRPETPVAFRVRNGAWPELKQALRETVYDGASALADWPAQADAEEYLLVSDGLLNYGKRTFPALGPQQRLYVLSSAGANADDEGMAALAEANRGRLVRWQRPEGIDAAAKKLLEDGPRVTAMDAVGAADLVAETGDIGDGVLRVAGRMTAPEAVLALTVREAGGERSIRIPVSSRTAPSETAARLWAGYSVRALGAQADSNRKRIEALGREFGIVTSETSLIVLDDLSDYARYGIEPPPRYRDEYERLRKAGESDRRLSRESATEQAVGHFRDRIAWWERKWPKGPIPKPEPQKETLLRARQAAQPAPAPPGMAQAAPAAANAATLDSVTVMGSADEERQQVALLAPGTVVDATITLQPWRPDSPYANRLRKASANEVYAVYLDERTAHATSSAFYLDVADVLIEKGQRDLALRVLSNLAEMDLEDRHVLRVLGYRLLQADAPELALPLFEQVLRWGEEEPQSYRDLGLAYAAVGRYQDAADMLYEVPTREWDGRFSGIDQIALAELNAVVAKAGGRVDTARFDARLLRNLPLDLRAVLSWDSDNSDMDLWVTDPNGEKAFYGHRLTYQGGAMSEDFTGGYGPEEFVLRDAKPGKYKVEANFFGDRQQLVTGATTLQLQLTTGFGTPQQRDRKVTLRLRERKDTILVGEFEVE